MATVPKAIAKCCPSLCLLLPWCRPEEEEEEGEEPPPPPTPPPLEPVKPAKPRGISLHMGTDNGLGQIAFTLRYDVRREILKVHIWYARDLVAMDPRGTSDPYVIVGFNPTRYHGVIYKTSVVKRTLKPKFNETFVFKNFPNEDLRTHSIRLLVQDWDKSGDDDPMGELEFPLKKLYKRIPGQKRRPKAAPAQDSASVATYASTVFDSVSQFSGNTVTASMMSGAVERQSLLENGRPRQIYDSVSMISRGATSAASGPDSVSVSAAGRTVFSESTAHHTETESEFLRQPSGYTSTVATRRDEVDRAGSVVSRQPTVISGSARPDDDRFSYVDNMSLVTRSTDLEGSVARLSSVLTESEIVEEVERPFVIRRLEIKKFLKPPPNSRYTFGELLLGIGFYPKHSVLIIKVVKGRHMRDPEGFTLNPYVTITLRRLTEKQEKTLQTVRTSVRSHVDIPVWNEQFEFKILPRHLKNTAVDVKVLSVASHASLLGQLRLAVKSYPTQREHFQAMMSNIGHNVERWHLVRQ